MTVGWLDRLFTPAAQPIGEVRPGQRVVVRGRVVPRDLIDSPLDGLRCVHYHFLVEGWQAPSILFPGAGGTWNVTHQDEAIAEFYLRDETGTLIVAPERATVTHRPFTPQYTDVERVSEATIVPGDLVEVTGQAEEVHDLLDGERSYRQDTRRLVLRAPVGGWLRIRKL